MVDIEKYINKKINNINNNYLLLMSEIEKLNKTKQLLNNYDNYDQYGGTIYNNLNDYLNDPNNTDIDIKSRVERIKIALDNLINRKGLVDDEIMITLEEIKKKLGNYKIPKSSDNSDLPKFIDILTETVEEMVSKPDLNIDKTVLEFLKTLTNQLDKIN